MQKQKISFLQIINHINCPKHNQPIVLVCIQKQCSNNQRTFCFQCNDESQLKKNTHILISAKKFDAMFTQYHNLLQVEPKVNLKDKITKTKVKIIDSFNILQSVLCTGSQQTFIKGQEQQIVKGKVNNLLKNGIWCDIFDMKNNKVSEDQISKILKIKSKNSKEKAFQAFQRFQNTINIQLQKIIDQFKNQKKITNKFSAQRKNSNLKLSKDQRGVSNTSQFGHYFCITEKDFDVHNTSYKFNMGNIGENTSYWLGFTFPSISQGKKWTNIYDQNQGGFFIVIFQKGKNMNFWNHQKPGFSNSQQIKAQKVVSYSSIELSINFQTKQLFFHMNIEGKKILIKGIKPLKWYGKIYPAVGFYGKQGTITIE